MKTVIIATSKFGNPVSNYYKALGEQFIKDGYKVIFVFDKLVTKLPLSTDKKRYYTWLNKRPTGWKDFVFLSQIIRKEQPEICISNFGATNVMSLVSFVYKVKHRINYIHTTSKQLRADSKHSKLRGVFLRLRKRLVLGLNTSFFTNSAGTKLDSIACYGIKEHKISVFPLLIAPTTIPYKSRNERECFIVIVGRLMPSKGHEQLLYQFSDSLVDYPDLKLKIVGDGYLRPILEALATKLNISKHVIFTGNISNTEIDKVFSNSLISVSASIDEAYGLVNIEALREGTPLICTKTAGSLDILMEDRNGVFFDTAEKGSLLNALRIVLPDWDEFSLNSKQVFDSNYALATIEKHYDIIKRNIL